MPDLTLSRCRPPARRLAGHAPALGQGRDRAARQRPLDAGGGRPRAHRRPAARARALARRAARGGALRPARLRLSGGPVPGRRAARARSTEAAEETGLEPALIERIWTAAGFSARLARAHRRGGPPAAALHGRGARRRLPARRVPAARARLRPGARPDRRRRGQALPPLRARAADPRRRPRARDRRGDGGPRRRSCCRSPRRSWTACTSARCSTSSTRTSSATSRLEGAGDEPRAPARGDRLRRPRGLHAADRGGRRGGGASTSSSASSRRSRRRCPTTRA